MNRSLSIAIASFALTAALIMVAGCSDPLDDEPRGQRITSDYSQATRYAPGGGETMGAEGGMSGASGPSGSTSADPSPSAAAPRVASPPPTGPVDRASTPPSAAGSSRGGGE